MYRRFFGFRGKPFSIAPDPRFLYLSDRHREALAHLLFGLGEGGGFVQLTGEVGTGKTTLCRALLEQLPENVDVVLVLNPRVDAFELVKGICDELGLEYPEGTTSLKALVDVLNAYLIDAHARGRRTVLLIDEAQNLDRDVLEQVRLLTNLETAEEKLLQILLIGQPELKTLLAREDLRQLAQRITARYHLEPLDLDETRAYIRHRLRVCQGDIDIFTPAAIERIHRLSGGIPRVINILCDRALLGAYVEEKRNVDPEIVRRAAAEVLPETLQMESAAQGRHWPYRALGWGLGVLALLALAYVAFEHFEFPASGDEKSVAVQPSGDKRVLPVQRSEKTVPDSDTLPIVSEAKAGSSPATETGKGEGSEREETGLPARGAEFTAAVSSGAHEVETGQTSPDALADRILRLDYGDTLATWQHLFRRWEAAFILDSPRTPCQQAEDQGLRCLVLRGNWRQLRAFDRPAMLELVREDGTQVRALIDRWPEGGGPRVVLGTDTVEVEPESLERWWFGDFVLIWRPPIRHTLLRPGDRDLDVLWVRRQLARLLGPEVLKAEDPQRFDAALASAVRKFQAARGLRPDGIIGAQTLIHLNNLDPDFRGPHLDEPDA